MKKLFSLLFLFIAFAIQANSQSFSDNFDTYTAGSYLGISNNKWTTWSNSRGGADDIKISNAKSKSGANSIYFASTAGGPADVVLPFGGQYNSGELSVSFHLFVETNKKAYLNLQEQTTVGQGWSVDLNFDSAGRVTLINTISGNLLTANYSQNKWFKVEMKIDLNTNTWELLFDDVSIGLFQNAYRQVASLDIYAVAGSSFYVDDVAYTYKPMVKANLDASVTFIDKVLGYLAGTPTFPSIEIRNLGIQNITSLSVDFDYLGSKQTKNLGALNIASLATYTFSLDNPVVLKSGKSNVTATLVNVNGGADDVITNNTKVLFIDPITPAPKKLVIAEEATGTWCQWCPRGAVWLKNMDEKYHGLIQGIAVHNNDTMMYAPYDAGYRGINKLGYPAIMVDRGKMMDPSGMEPDFLTRILTPPAAVIRNGAQYNSATGELKISLTTKFLQAVSGNYKIACVLVEDSVTGKTSKYNQSNAYAGGSKGVMGGYEKLPASVPYSKMVYEHVARVISPEFGGLSNAFSNNINPGDSFTHNFTFTLYKGWKSNKIKIIGMIIEPGGMIDNGSSTLISEASANGFINGTFVADVEILDDAAKSVMVYPNPTNGTFNLLLNDETADDTKVAVYDLQARLIYNSEHNGLKLISIDAQNWPAGIYVAHVQNGGKSYTLKMMRD